MNGKKMWYVHILQDKENGTYTHNEILFSPKLNPVFEAIWMSLEKIMLNEIRQVLKFKCFMFLLSESKRFACIKVESGMVNTRSLEVKDGQDRESWLTPNAK